jgi:hypothetical protein
VKAETVGYTRNFPVQGKLEFGAGGSLTFYQFASTLDPVYGDFPVSYNVFLRLRYGAHFGMAGMGHSHPGR